MFILPKGRKFIRILLPLSLTVLLLLALGWAAARAESQAAAQALRLTEESIRRAAVQCYALEGFYPVNINYLMEHYGILPDTSRFIIHYQFIADNLLPDITVLPIER